MVSSSKVGSASLDNRAKSASLGSLWRDQSLKAAMHSAFGSRGYLKPVLNASMRCKMPAIFRRFSKYTIVFWASRNEEFVSCIEIKSWQSMAA